MAPHGRGADAPAAQRHWQCAAPSPTSAIMSEALYNTEILRLAASVPHQQRLAAPDASVTRVSPICGSKITVDVGLNGDRVSSLGQDVRACALGQASAAIMGQCAPGSSLAELAEARDALQAFLKSGGPAPGGLFGRLEIFAPAIPHRSRHGSILLAWEAVVEAARQAAGQPEAQPNLQTGR